MISVVITLDIVIQQANFELKEVGSQSTKVVIPVQVGTHTNRHI